MMFKRYFWISATLLAFCCGSQALSEVADLPPKNVLEGSEVRPRPDPTMIGKSWTPAQKRLLNDMTNRLSDRICDVVDDVLKPYARANKALMRFEWSVNLSFWLGDSGRATRVTFDGTTTKQDLDRSLLSSMQRIDLKRTIPSWVPMPVRTRIAHSRKNVIGGCRLKHLRSK